MLSTSFVLLAVSGILFNAACKARDNFTWLNDTSPGGGERTCRLPKYSEIQCGCFASCAPGVDHHGTCFCDRHCRLFADCCIDYIDEPGSSQQPLPPGSFTCSAESVKPFYVITECPVTYTVHLLRDVCQRGFTSERTPSNETFYAVPVSSRTSGLVYRNVYCAACHGEADVAFWQVEIMYCNPPLKIDDLMQQNSFVGDCLFSYLPTSDVPTPRYCVFSLSRWPIIDTCPVGTDAELASRCAESSNVAYVYRDAQAYRNRDCAVRRLPRRRLRVMRRGARAVRCRAVLDCPRPERRGRLDADDMVW